MRRIECCYCCTRDYNHQSNKLITLVSCDTLINVAVSGLVFSITQASNRSINQSIKRSSITQAARSNETITQCTNLYLYRCFKNDLTYSFYQSKIFDIAQTCVGSDPSDLIYCTAPGVLCYIVLLTIIIFNQTLTPKSISMNQSINRTNKVQSVSRRYRVCG